MELMRGDQLGALQQQFGIAPDARVSIEITQAGPTFWDWSTGIEYIVNPPNVHKSGFDVPAWVTEILKATDDVLKQRWKNGEGWTDERSAIFSELTCRGVRVRDFPPSAFG
jgi:hypothetical protein